MSNIMRKHNKDATEKLDIDAQSLGYDSLKCTNYTAPPIPTSRTKWRGSGKAH